MHRLVLAAISFGVGAVAIVGTPAMAETELSKEERCLALAMYWEAKAEGADGMIAVGAVVLNRVAHSEFPGSVCGVVTQGGETPPCQFSWWCDGKSDRPTEAEAWATARELAPSLLTELPYDPTKGGLFFHASNIDVPWRVKRERTVQIGKHIYYR
ncbi:cell wall hydrolase [Denitrobaculum tricleocarpae]|uniref:Cell wall hydrolase n=1 Tax=Denitrobaculum tricleocarpae TaxID=2591009 RepID=A0A545TUH1_9PROT|nr:cell wall hydrolase [Denitrobaculum tricleocarpae]TQV80867.1 cell wall hydrolase [Denitrobaculum tricleocarpae]